MKIKNKIIHILPHNIYKFFPDIKKDNQLLKFLDHHSTRFISNIIDHDLNNKFSHELWVIWNNSFEIKHQNWFLIKVFPQDFTIFLPLETSFSIIRAIHKEIKNNKKKTMRHVHAYYLWMFDFIVIYLKLKWQKFFAHHRWGWFTWKALPYSIYKYIFVLPVILRFCKNIFVQNKSEYKRLQNLYRLNKNRLTFFPNVTIKQPKKNIFLNNNRINIVFLWRLEKIKWIDDILSVLLFLHNNFVDFFITFIWNWSLETNIDKFCKKNKINYSITWWLSKDKVDELLKKQDLFIIANKKSEWSSNAVLEAQSFWLPVISYNIEWINDFIIDWQTWYLVENIVEFKDKLLYLTKDIKLLKQFSSNAQNNINNNFLKEKYFKKIVEIYKQYT